MGKDCTYDTISRVRSSDSERRERIVEASDKLEKLFFNKSLHDTNKKPFDSSLPDASAIRTLKNKYSKITTVLTPGGQTR